MKGGMVGIRMDIRRVNRATRTPRSEWSIEAEGSQNTMTQEQKRYLTQLIRRRIGSWAISYGQQMNLWHEWQGNAMDERFHMGYDKTHCF